MEIFQSIALGTCIQFTGAVTVSVELGGWGLEARS